MITFSEHHCPIYSPLTGWTDRQCPEGTSAPRPLQSALLHHVANIILGKALPFEVHFGFAPQTYVPSSPKVRNFCVSSSLFCPAGWTISPRGKEKPFRELWDPKMCEGIPTAAPHCGNPATQTSSRLWGKSCFKSFGLLAPGREHILIHKVTSLHEITEITHWISWLEPSSLSLYHYPQTSCEISARQSFFSALWRLRNSLNTLENTDNKYTTNTVNVHAGKATFVSNMAGNVCTLAVTWQKMTGRSHCKGQMTV